MKSIQAVEIERVVCETLLDAHFSIDPTIEEAIQQAERQEKTALPCTILQQILENYQIAKEEQIPLCQDSGMTVVFAELGQDVHIEGDFEAAVNRGVGRAYKEGYLRPSTVCDPLFDRRNTGNGIPAIIHTRLVPGDALTLTVMAKGFGSENCSQLRLFVPATPIEEIKAFIVDAAVSAGAKSCPPVIVGVGIGGAVEKAAELSKWALSREITARNTNSEYAKLEAELLSRINRSGIGPGGLGGLTTALAVNIEVFPTHIASIPVAINLCCHASRHKRVVL